MSQLFQLKSSFGKLRFIHTTNYRDLNLGIWPCVLILEKCTKKTRVYYPEMKQAFLVRQGWGTAGNIDVVVRAQGYPWARDKVYIPRVY